MAVVTNITIPNAGAVLVPLGGNGSIAPHSMILGNFGSLADVSGGTLTITVTLDPRWDNLVAWLESKVTTAGAADAVVFGIIPQHTTAAGITVGGVSHWDAGLSDIARLSWAPPPYFAARQIQMEIPNTDGQLPDLNAMIYQFKKDAWRTTPLSILLASLPTSGTVQ